MAEDLSVEQAVSLLATPEQATEETQQQTDTEAQTAGAEDASEGETPGDGEQVDEQAEAAADALDPPPLWDAEDKAWFAEQSPEAQAKILKQEVKRESVTSKAKQEAAEAAKVAKAEVSKIGELANKANETLSRAEIAFQSRWENVNWVAYAQGVRDGQFDQAEYLLNKEQYEADKQLLAEVKETADRTAAADRATKTKEQMARLLEMAPELTGAKAAANQQALITYVLSKGATNEDCQLIDTNAFAASMAWKAHQFDKGQEALKARPKTPAIPQKGNTVPTATPQRTPQQRSVEQINARFQKSGSVDDGVALLMAKGF